MSEMSRLTFHDLTSKETLVDTFAWRCRPISCELFHGYPVPIYESRAAVPRSSVAPTQKHGEHVLDWICSGRLPVFLVVCNAWASTSLYYR
jgi:hypothetical protein